MSDHSVTMLLAGDPLLSPTHLLGALEAEAPARAIAPIIGVREVGRHRLARRRLLDTSNALWPRQHMAMYVSWTGGYYGLSDDSGDLRHTWHLPLAPAYLEESDGLTHVLRRHLRDDVAEAAAAKRPWHER